ncbi:hypothetical protein RHOSPDRAFT_34576 [Rhodotorula sp. JG-1b]|nr:hypothetical protein RHOSPDRAFT_34576 [Rhodotorula sp. JG-1b]
MESASLDSMEPADHSADSKPSGTRKYELGMDRRKPYAKSVVQAMQLRIDTLEAQLAALTGDAAPASAAEQTPCPPPPLDANSWESLVGTAMSVSSASTESTSPDLYAHHAGASPSLQSSFVGSSSGGNGRPGPPPPGTMVASGSSSSSNGRPVMSGNGGANGELSRSVLSDRRSSLNNLAAATTIEDDPEMDKFRGGLALNAHGELRYYGPTSCYRSVLVATPSQSIDDSVPTASQPIMPSAALQALRSYSLTRAPIPTAAPCDPIYPTRPPDLSPDLKARLFRLAFEYCFSHYNMVPERQFYQDLQMYPNERTQFYSPFLMHVVLAVGCRYLQPEDDYPPELCGLFGDPDTRGDVFVNWARFLLDQEWYNPSMSTIRGLLVLGLYMAGRGFDGPCQIFVGLALKLAEDFGLNLGSHRLAQMPAEVIPKAVSTSRSECFWAAFASDCISSLYIGRRAYFTPDMIDTAIPAISPELDYDAPLYRSSAFAWSSRLMLLAGRVLCEVYSPSMTKSAQQRKALVPELHLKLESWNHDLPSYLRANGHDPTKAPHPHILALNMTYHFVHIALHRPFFRQSSASTTTGGGKQETTEDVSTEKCLIAANNIVRLVRLSKGSSGLTRTAPGVQLAAFSAGTVLALAAFPKDGCPFPADERSPEDDKRIQAKKDLYFLIEALKEIGATWTTALTSAGVLEAIVLACEPANLPSTASPKQPQMPTPPLTDFTTSVPLPSIPTAVPPLPSDFQALLNPPNPTLLEGDPFSRFQYGLGLSGSAEDSRPSTGVGLAPTALPLNSETFRAMWSYGSSVQDSPV